MLGQLQDIYAPIDESGKERKPSLQPYPVITWDTIDFDQFNMVPLSVLPLDGAIWIRLPVFQFDSNRIRARLYLRLRVLHRHRILW